MKTWSFEIESDCLDIVKRIKSIDKSYFVVFNTSKQAFELHSHGQRNTYCLTFPYSTLDERAVDLTLKTRVRNSDALFAEMEAENQKAFKANCSQILNDFKERLYDS